MFLVARNDIELPLPVAELMKRVVERIENPKSVEKVQRSSHSKQEKDKFFC